MDRPESVIYGDDAKVIATCLQVHGSKPTNKLDILDVTHNKGVMWKGTGLTVTSLDIDPTFGTDIVDDFMELSKVKDDSYDVVVFDPPHLPAAIASNNSSGMWANRYGLTNQGAWRQGDTISDCFPPFLSSAERVLRKDGIILAKLADFVHNHKYQWSHVDFICAVRNSSGLVACDTIIKADPRAANLKSSKWKNVRHFRRAHAYWIVVRKGKCESPLK